MMGHVLAAGWIGRCLPKGLHACMLVLLCCLCFYACAAACELGASSPGLGGQNCIPACFAQVEQWRFSLGPCNLCTHCPCMMIFAYAVLPVYEV
jgi:hypothetical protein